jgi:hypothetical protein
MTTPTKKQYVRHLGASTKKRPHVVNKRVLIVNQVLRANGKYTVPAKSPAAPLVSDSVEQAKVVRDAVLGPKIDAAKIDAAAKLDAPGATLHPARAAWEEYSKGFAAVGIHPKWDELSDGEKVEWARMVDAALSVTVSDGLAEAIKELHMWKEDYAALRAEYVILETKLAERK